MSSDDIGCALLIPGARWKLSSQPEDWLMWSATAADMVTGKAKAHNSTQPWVSKQGRPISGIHIELQYVWVFSFCLHCLFVCPFVCLLLFCSLCDFDVFPDGPDRSTEESLGIADHCRPYCVPSIPVEAPWSNPWSWKVTHLADQHQSQHQGIHAMSRNVAPISM